MKIFLILDWNSKLAVDWPVGGEKFHVREIVVVDTVPWLITKGEVNRRWPCRAWRVHSIFYRVMSRRNIDRVDTTSPPSLYMWKHGGSIVRIVFRSFRRLTVWKFFLSSSRFFRNGKINILIEWRRFRTTWSLFPSARKSKPIICDWWFPGNARGDFLTRGSFSSWCIIGLFGKWFRFFSWQWNTESFHVIVNSRIRVKFILVTLSRAIVRRFASINGFIIVFVCFNRSSTTWRTL